MLFRKSALTKALTGWLNDDSPRSDDKKSLSDYLPPGDDSLVNTAAEAKLVCAAIDKARNVASSFIDDWSADNDVHTAVSLMQQVGGAEARDALIQQGLPRLRLLVRDRLAQPDAEDRYTLFALKIIGLYRQADDVKLFVDAIRAPYKPDSFWWQTAFYGFDADHPGTRTLLAALASPLPTEFIRVVYLDKCNALALEGFLDSHPFASQEGVAALEQYLSSTKEDEASYAVSACAALPFIAPADRERLLAVADRHPSVNVQIEAAWAGAKLGSDVSAQKLIAFSLDARYSARAVAYLKEIGLEARIPAQVNEPEFIARAEMCEWLAHPNEMGRPPDDLTLADTRELYWPPTKDRRRMWVFRYTYNKDGEAPDEGYALVGSVTWAMFGQNTRDLKPEDVYGLHCAWELIQCEDPAAPPETDVAAGRAILAKHNRDFGRPTLSVVTPAR